MAHGDALSACLVPGGGDFSNRETWEGWAIALGLLVVMAVQVHYSYLRRFRKLL